jgi:hypothetical protein
MVSSEDCIAIDKVGRRGKTFKFNPSISLEVREENSCGKLFLVEHPRLEIFAFGATRVKLRQEIEEQILFILDEYVFADDSKLSPAAQKLKERWLKLLCEE